ncbi:MAG: mechanosensitive ion channel [Thiovulaceae bacterium]|nr:mechanosensitive ion channel [Sulfurimonadaceae bacterium]
MNVESTIDKAGVTTEYDFYHLLHVIIKTLTEPMFSINNTQISLAKLFTALMVFILAFVIGGFYKVQINKRVSKKANISSSTQTILANMGYYLIIVIAFFIMLNILGINLSSLALVAGALSVGIGFGLQNIVSNFVSGLILMFERSVKVGDFVELSDSLRGRVLDIRMRSTIISTNANINVIVPNQSFIQNSVINWTMHDMIKRFEIPFGVAYGTKPQVVIDVIMEAVENSGFSDIYRDDEKKSRVVMTKMNNSSVDFELFIWVKGDEILRPKRTISRFLILIYDTLYENGIEIPFPQMDLHIKEQKTKLPTQD